MGFLQEIIFYTHTQKEEAMNKNYKRTIVLIITGIFALMLAMMIYTFQSFSSRSISDIEALGESNLYNESARIENYIQTGLNTLWVTADTVNYMMEKGATSDEILSCLQVESAHQTDRIDENFTGIYGYIRGEYLDGAGWVPDADYVPQDRDWYIAAKNARGEPTLVAPYVDAQTNTIMVSVSQLLDDGESVVSLDIALNEIQKITEEIQLENMGYGFIVDENGLVIAHFNESEKGKNYSDKDHSALLAKVCEVKKGRFSAIVNGEKCMVFTDQIYDSWHVVMVISDTKLFENLRKDLIVNAVVCIVVLLIIIIFSVQAYQRIKLHEKQDEDSKLKLDMLNANIVKALAYTIDAKDRYTSGHSQRVANYSLELAKRMGKSEEEQKAIYYAGLLHDVGKIRVPEDVINKPGKLTDEEFDHIRIHPVSGFHTLKDIYDDKRIPLGAKYHHERYDGTGYPNGLAGENIPEVARIIGVADAYDAMASNRSYRNALPQDVARAEIEKGKGKQFDPHIANYMLEMIDEDKDYQMCQMDVISKNLLVIDDEPMNIKMVEFILKNEPVKVYSAKSGEEGLALVKDTPMDLVLLDIVMPNMDGFEVYDKLREITDVPVVFMTADKNLDSIKKSSEIGIEDYVTKPFLPMVLKETVHGIVNQWG